MIDQGLGYVAPNAGTTNDANAQLLQDQIDDLQDQINSLPAAGAKNLSDLLDIELPGPNPATRGSGVLVPDGSGHFRLIPRIVFMTDALFLAWKASEDDNAPLAIVNTTLPSGTVGTAITTTTLTAAHGMPVYAWSVNTSSGDALPTGVTLTSNSDGTATFAGTPAAGTNKTYNVVIEVVDGLGEVCDAHFTFTIAAIGANLDITLPTFADGVVGLNYGPLDISGGITGGTGPYAVYSYSANPTTVSTDGTAHTIHGTGLGSLAANSGVAFHDITGLTGITADTKYFVVNPNAGADTIQISATFGGSAMTTWSGNVTNRALYRTTLPNHKLQMTSAGVISTSAAFSASDADPGVVNFSVTVFDSAGHSVTKSASINVKNLSTGPQIQTTTVPTGQATVAYTSTQFVATDADSGYSLTWSLNTTAGVALPTGMTFSATGILGGTPGAGTDAGLPYPIVVRCTDTSTGNPGSGLYDEQLIALTITAAPGGTFSFTPDAQLPDANEGSAYGPYKLSQKIANAGGSVTYDSYDDSKKKVNWTADATNSVFSKSGGTAPAADTRVSFSNIAGSGNVANGPSHSYWVINVGTTGGNPSFQVSNTKGGSAVALTGLSGSTVTINFPTIPTHGLQLDTSTGDITATASALIAGTITNICLAADNGSTRLTVTGIKITINGGTSQNLATISGIVLGSTTSKTTAKANTDKLNSAIASMRSASPQGYIYYDSSSLPTQPDKPRITVALSSGNYLQSGDGSHAGLNKWYVGNVEIFVVNDDNIPDNYGVSFLLSLQNATAPEMQVWLNGNAVHQKQFDVTRSGNELGMQMTGISITGCGPIKWGGSLSSPAQMLNMRSLTGAGTGPSQRTGGVDIGGVHYWATECFSVHQGHCDGGATGWVHVECNDGGDQGGDGDSRNSGFTIEQMVHDSRFMFTPCVIVVTAVNCRHGMGCFGGGYVNWAAGTSATGCDHGINCEAGDGAHDDSEATRRVLIGNATSPQPGDVQTTNCGTYGIQYNGNRSSGIGQFDVYGWKSTGDHIPISATGFDPSVHDVKTGDPSWPYNNKITLHDAVVVNPKQNVDNFSTDSAHNKDCASHVILSGTCKYTGLPSGKTVHGGGAPGTGSWINSA